MAVNVTYTLTNVTNPDYPKLIDGRDVGLFSVTVVSTIELLKYSYSVGGSNTVTDMPLVEPVDGVYTYNIEFQILAAQDHVYLLLYDGNGYAVHKEPLAVSLYGYYSPEIFGYSGGIEWPNNLSPDIARIGKATVFYEFIWWGGFFKGSDYYYGTPNHLTLTYTYKSTNSSYWPEPKTIYDGTRYPNDTVSGSVKFDVLETLGSYTVKFTISDDITSKTITVDLTDKPIFDWGATDFNFNVDVKASSDMYIANDKSLIGMTKSGATQELISLKSDNNLYIGQGNLSGDTYITGKSIQLITPTGAGNISGLLNAISNSYTLPTETDNASTSALLFTRSATAVLHGNCLYCRFYVTGLYEALRHDDYDASTDIADFALGMVRIQHDGKITGAEYMTAVPGQSGVTAGVQMKNINNDGTYLEFDVYLCNSTGPMDSLLVTFNIPVSLDLNAF